jgi:hypothetical protein
MNCPNGHVSTSTDYCSVCGVKMMADPAPATSGDPAPSQNPVCPKCQTTQLDPSAQFCENCGHKLDVPVPKVSTPAQGAAISLQPADGGPPNGSPTTPLDSPDLPTSELRSAIWRIECRVFKENAASEEAAHGTYESSFELILENQVTQIGRSSQKRNLHPEIACDWDDAVSHRHAKIELDPYGSPFLVDVGSTNGTMVNGQIISANTPTKLKDGDRISLGGKTALIVHGPQN